CELHPRGPQIQSEHCCAVETPQATMEIAGRTLEKEPADSSEHRIAKIAMQIRHRTRLDSPKKTVAHHQVIAISQLIDERPEVGEVITVIRVAHDHVFTASGSNASHQGIAVSLSLNLNHSRTQRPGNLLRTISAAVVSY